MVAVDRIELSLQSKRVEQLLVAVDGIEPSTYGL